jgi:hypothetical protein
MQAHFGGKDDAGVFSFHQDIKLCIMISTKGLIGKMTPANGADDDSAWFATGKEPNRTDVNCQRR